MGGDRQPDAPKGPRMCCGGGQRLGQPGHSPTPLLLSTWLRGSPRLEGTGLRRPLSLASWTRRPARSSGDQGRGVGHLLPPPRAPPRPGEAQGCSPPGLHLLATEDMQQGGGGSSGVEAHTSGLGPGPVTCGRTGHPICLECVVLMAPAEAPGPRVGPAVLLTAAIVVGADQLALLVCGHRAQLTGPPGQGRKPWAAPPWARGRACAEEGDTPQVPQEGETRAWGSRVRRHPADGPGG